MPAQLLWATDVHLDHVGHPEAAVLFGEYLRSENPHATGLLVTGDIGEAPSITKILLDLQGGFCGPLYFVLGNHDYYRGDFASVDKRVHEACLAHPELIWLRKKSHILDDGVALVGTDGFYDARNGNPDTPLQLSDFMLISDLFAALDEGQSQLHALLRARADELASGLETQILSLLHAENLRQVIIATHVPPYAEAAFHQGKPSDATWSPYFSSRATGDMLGRLVAEFPKVTFTTLCGHTHGEGTFIASANHTVYTGRATYGAPKLAGYVRREDNPGSLYVVDLFSSAA